jgi:hypothetical protein
MAVVTLDQDGIRVHLGLGHVAADHGRRIGDALDVDDHSGDPL